MNTNKDLDNFSWDTDPLSTEIDIALGIINEPESKVKPDSVQTTPNNKTTDVSSDEDDEDKEIQKLKEKAAKDALAQIEDEFNNDSDNESKIDKGSKKIPPVNENENTGKKLSGADFLIETLSEIDELEGLIDTEGLENDEDKINAVVKSYDTYFESRFEELIEESDSTTKKFFQFIKDGGTGDDFIKKFKSVSSIPSFNEDTDGEKIIKYYQTEIMGMDEDDADLFVENLRDTSQIEKYASKYLPKIEDKKAKEEASIIANQKAQKERDRLNAEKYIKAIKDTSNKISVVGDIKIGKKEAGEIKDYILKGTVETDNGTMSAFNFDLQKALSDPEKRFAIAKLLRSEFKISDAVKTTDVIKKVNSTLQRTQVETETGKPKSFLDFL